MFFQSLLLLVIETCGSKLSLYRNIFYPLTSFVNFHQGTLKNDTSLRALWKNQMGQLIWKKKNVNFISHIESNPNQHIVIPFVYNLQYVKSFEWVKSVVRTFDTNEFTVRVSLNFFSLLNFNASSSHSLLLRKLRFNLQIKFEMKCTSLRP